jgi:farnesyl diphosphate synthase/geranylgeranyl diphosphate synthase type II
MTEILAPYQDRVNQYLEKHLNHLVTPEPLGSAISYSLFNGGKRVRPTLVYMTLLCFKEDLKPADPVAAAIEMIHSYSLVHDDLPAMDDDDLRRGKPTCHIAFDEATAILAGDALQTLAFQLLADAEEIPPATRLQLISLISQASGAEGMVAGQMIDLNAENSPLTPEQLRNMHQNKTGALITASIAAGALLGDADSSTLDALSEFGQSLGLAFQVRDDVLDVSGDTAVMGKIQGSDLHSNKTTFVSSYGLEGAQQELEHLRLHCQETLQRFSNDTHRLQELTLA